VQGADLLGQEDAVPQAVDRLEEAVRGAPTSARYRFRLCLAYLKAQRTADALQALQETLRLSPGHERANRALQTLARSTETRDGKTR
jgi:cytochrome c-type biogenesis protein CcmH/NrfG